VSTEVLLEKWAYVQGDANLGVDKITGNTGQIIKGKAEKVKGKIQEDVGKAKRKL
jgi:uncharacterized protein YjbJ (UPF0337 family)